MTDTTLDRYGNAVTKLTPPRAVTKADVLAAARKRWPDAELWYDEPRWVCGTNDVAVEAPTLAELLDKITAQ